MTDDYQIEVPPSFVALYLDSRKRLTVPLRGLRQRYEACEDLAQQLVDHAETLRRDADLPGREVLDRMRAGLAGEDSVVSTDEATWVVRRLAELLGWNWLPAPDPDELSR